MFAVIKSIVFYGVWSPSAGTDFMLAMLKNLGFYVVLGLRGEAGRKKMHLEVVWLKQGPDIGPKMAEHGATWG